jgi:hypothetical protein
MPVLCEHREIIIERGGANNDVEAGNEFGPEYATRLA